MGTAEYNRRYYQEHKEKWLEYNRTRREKYPEREREYGRAGYARNPERILERRRLWWAANPEKIRAKVAVREAVRKGRMLPQPCEVCGEKRVHAHHEDYDKPLEVRWLCPKHHMREHHSD